MTADDLITLNEQIASMARAGLPLDQGLAALAREMGRGRLQRLTAEIAEDLRAGHPLPEAIQRRGERVPPFYAGLIQAGVRSGNLGAVLATLTVYARSISDLRATIANALFYPLVVLAFAGFLAAFLCFYIIPQFEQIFRDFNMKLPALTEWVFAIARDPLKVIVLPLAIMIAVVWARRVVLRRTETGRIGWAHFVYAVPVAGGLIQSSRLAAFTELLAILVDNGVPLPEAFRLAGQASSDPRLAVAGRHVEEDMGQGLSLGEALRNRGLVPELIAWMTNFGEHRGTLGTTLHRVADIYRKQAELRASMLRSMLPPTLIVSTAGVIVALFVLAVMMPLIKLLEGLSQ
jgi:type II secretory pathway component PulF